MPFTTRALTITNPIYILILSGLLTLSISCTKKDPAASKTMTDTPSPLAGSKPAPSKCDKAAETLPKIADTSPAFPKLFAFYKEYEVCMDASIATAAQISTVEILDKKWSELNSFVELSAKDPKFKTFVLNNINALVTGMTLEVSNIISHAKSKCPSGQEELCKEIKARGEQALKDDIEESEALSNAAPPPPPSDL